MTTPVTTTTSTPTPPQPDLLQKVETTVATDAKAATSWLLLHERLLITVLVIAIGAFFANKILSHEADKDKAASDQAALVLKQAQDQNKQAAIQVSQLSQQYTTLVAQLTQQNAQLAASQQQRTVVLQTQQTQDQTIPMPDLVNRWTQLANTPASNFTTTTAGVSVTPEAARATVVQLEAVPVLTQNIASEQTENANLTKELDSSNTLNTALSSQVTGLNTTLTDQTKVCTTQITTVKAEARKSKLHLFGIGFGIGFITGLVADHALKF